MEVCLSDGLVQKLQTASFSQLIEVNREVQSNLAVEIISLIREDDLAKEEVFAAIVKWALESGISAADVAGITGVARSTPQRWASGEASPRYTEARVIFSRKILDKIRERFESKTDSSFEGVRPPPSTHAAIDIISITDDRENCTTLEAQIQR